MPTIPTINNSNTVRGSSLRNSSNVSTFTSQQKRTYVRRYAMTQNQKRIWLKNHMPERSSGVLTPSKKEIRSIERSVKPRNKERVVKIFSVIFCFVLIAVFA